MKRLLARFGARVAHLNRRPVLHRVIVSAIPAAVRALFDPRAAEDLDTTFELCVRDPRRAREPARFTIAVHDGRCQVFPGGAADAAAVVTAGADDLVLMVSGAAGWPELLSSGRLKLTGNPFLALRFPVLFRLPPATQPPARTRRSARVRRTRHSSRSAATT